MVTSYYLMKLSKKKCSNTENNSLIYNSYKESSKKCRVCLKEGSIPIFGNNRDIPKALALFGDIQVREDDDFPKLLCQVCFKFINEVINFRRIAKETEKILKQPLKEELDTFEDNQLINQCIDDGHEEITIECVRDSNFKEFKKVKIKPSQKVTCHVCKKVINRSYIKEHITMHDPDHEKYVCEVCGKSFRLRCAYHNHKLRHRTDFPYKCQFCPYRGRYAELLKTHLRTHTGDYRYMCTECPARFLFKSNLNSHMLKHKEPQFRCETCKRAFHTKLMLQRHFAADHLGIKNHVCSVCGKAFGYRNAMMKHQRHVHKREKSVFGRMPSYLAEQKQLNSL